MAVDGSVKVKPRVGGWGWAIAFFGFLGGLIGFASLKSSGDDRRAWHVLKWGLVVSLFSLVLWIATVVGLVALLAHSTSSDINRIASTETTPNGVSLGTNSPEPTTPTTSISLDDALVAGKTYTARITTSLGVIVVKLDAENAPIGASHFVTLARSGVYNGSRFHRVIFDFVIQGGAPGGDESVSYGHSVVAEPPKANYREGDLAAAKTAEDPAGTFDSQFFVITGPQGTALPPDYADFGTVTAGMDIVRTINAQPTQGDAPVANVTIDKVTVTER